MSAANVCYRDHLAEVPGRLRRRERGVPEKEPAGPSTAGSPAQAPAYDHESSDGQHRPHRARWAEAPLLKQTAANATRLAMTGVACHQRCPHPYICKLRCCGLERLAKGAPPKGHAWRADSGSPACGSPQEEPPAPGCPLRAPARSSGVCLRRRRTSPPAVISSQRGVRALGRGGRGTGRRPPAAPAPFPLIPTDSH